MKQPKTVTKKAAPPAAADRPASAKPSAGSTAPKPVKRPVNSAGKKPSPTNIAAKKAASSNISSSKSYHSLIRPVMKVYFFVYKNSVFN